MKTLSCLTALALVSLFVFAACGEPSSGPTCAQVCDKMNECDPEEDLVECNSMCASFSDVMRASAYEALGDCYMEQTCDFLNQNGDYCFGQAMDEGDIAPVEALFERICEKAVSCAIEPGYTVQACLDEFTGANGGSDDMYISMAMFKPSVLDCVGDCIEAASCDALAEDGITTCFGTCGLDFMLSEEDIE